ncbi:uncharacterized protein LOC122854536 [Aphidius gifuensis]|uniref:uncharacterized protein LOC122854536 n=1 Tax=Aphidius gifuensis TaxID=684658 RepID=UPI001CDD682D|nr:uncharacterized protein LOC122854536 [Aphidius gifuensis]
MKFIIVIVMFAFVALAMAESASGSVKAEEPVAPATKVEEPEASDKVTEQARDKRGYVLGTYTYNEPIVYSSYPTVYRTAPVHYARTYTYPSFYSPYESHVVL